jgi:uncharacterized protein (TIGR02145 family)
MNQIKKHIPKTLLATLFLVVFATLVFAAFVPPFLQDTSEMTDGRDGTIYKTVRIAGKYWLAENLIYDTSSGSYWYNSKKGAGKGKLYTWEAAKTACPTGWHLPTDEEWQQLEVALGMDATQAKDIGFRGTDEGKKLKFKGNSGMNLQLGGFRHSDGTFGDLGEKGFYWSATPHNTTGTALRRSFNANSDQVYRTNHDVTYGYSCRCVEN